MASWETQKIKYCAKLSPPCDTSKLLPDSEVTFTPMEYIKNGYFINRKAPFSAINSSYTQYQEGDIVIAKVTPCFENGNIAEMCGLYSGFGFGSSELFVLRPYNIQSRFLFYALQSEDFKEKGCATMTGTGGLKRVSPAFIANYRIAVPQPDEQKRIAKLLDKKCAEIDAVLEKTRTSIEEYKKLKQAIITQAVTKGIRGDRPMKESGVIWLDTVPAEWTISKIKYTIFPKEKPVLPMDEVITCFRDGTVTLRRNRREEGFTISFTENGYQGVDVGDLVIHGMDTFAGAIGCSDSRGKTSPVVHVCSTVGNNRYFMYFLRYMAYSGVLMDFSNGVRIRSSDFRNFKKLAVFEMLVPPLREQNKIVDYLDSTLAKIDQVIKQKEILISELEACKKSAIYEYVTGKREVPNAY